MFQSFLMTLLRSGPCIIAILLLIGCGTSPPFNPNGKGAFSPSIAHADDAEEYSVVNCLLPGQIRHLGGMTYVGKRKPLQTTVGECKLRGGEYVLDEPASFQAALSIWQEAANRGDAEAQYYTGEIYEKGLAGQQPDYQLAAAWYQKAASQGYKRAAVNLGRLYEQGLGVKQDEAEAVRLYRKAAGQDKNSGALLMESAVEAPIIDLIDPPLTISGGSIRLSLPEGERQQISGRAIAPAGLQSLTVNGQSVPTSDNGFFRTELPKYRSSNNEISLQIVAIDNRNQRATLQIIVSAGTRGEAQLSNQDILAEGFGRYYALVIGNDKYHYWTPLDNAVNDARAVAKLLEQHYDFEVTELYNAERSAILSTINNLRKKLTEKDNFLIYYAGHGHLVEQLDEGYWIPVDAKQDDNTEWISTRNITGQLKIMSAKHVLVVADSCYAGTLSRGSLSRLKAGISNEKRLQLLQSFASSRVRTALTSGGVQPVLDSGGSDHSVFTKAFLDVLQENGLVLETERLFLAIRERVSDAAFDLNVRQIPTYEPIHMAGHEAGDFVFVPH
ncbi:caspase family protein [Marinobacter sp. ATCH36]|uniref:caspase family protein n=1 Tax=Marinobacter sp. ATCH36 TaxID=2945106 RepID=UPI00201FC524|nr:caspase family protein [Marinobacter sp. ATCH36]MCL7943689.1 caspase family protein [Marinobacter sp. ATCH36]